MSFKVGDWVKLDGEAWPSTDLGAQESGRPMRGTVVKIIAVAMNPEFQDWYYVSGRPSRLYIPAYGSWHGTLVEAEPAPTNPRTEGLNQAIRLIDGDREGVYGDPLVSHERIGKLWSALLGVEINAHQVAMMMAAMKLSRLAGQAEHKDSWIDLAGYAGLGYEFVVRGESS